MTREDFVDWKRHPVTQQVFSQLHQRMEYFIDEIISQTATVSQAEMAEKAGAVKAIRDILNIEFEGEDSSD